MFPMILAFLGGWRGVVQLGLITTLVGILAGYVYSYDARGREITELKAQLQIERANVKVEKANVALRDASIEVLNEHLSASIKGLEQACELIKAVESSNDPGADKPVGNPTADVLGKIKQNGD